MVTAPLTYSWCTGRFTRKFRRFIFLKKLEPLTLSINSKGEIFIQESKVEYEKIIAKVLAVSKNRTDTRIYVRGDKTINYGRVLEIMGLLSGCRVLQK